MGVHWSKDSSSKNRKKKKVALPVVDGVIPKPKSKIQGRWLVQGASERYGVFCLGGQFRWYVEMVVEASTSWGREGTHLPTSLHSGSIFLKVRGRRNQCLFWVALPLQFLPAPSYARVEKPGFHHFREKASGFSPRKPKAARDGKALVGSLVFLSLLSLSLYNTYENVVSMLGLHVSCKGLPTPWFKWNIIPRWKSSSAGKVRNIICLYTFSSTKKKKRETEENSFAMSYLLLVKLCTLPVKPCSWTGRSGVAPKTSGRSEETRRLSLWLAGSVLHSFHFLHAWLKLKAQKKNKNLGLSSGNCTDVNWMESWHFSLLCHHFLWPEDRSVSEVSAAQAKACYHFQK